MYFYYVVSDTVFNSIDNVTLQIFIWSLDYVQSALPTHKVKLNSSIKCKYKMGVWSRPLEYSLKKDDIR